MLARGVAKQVALMEDSPRISVARKPAILRKASCVHVTSREDMGKRAEGRTVHHQRTEYRSDYSQLHRRRQRQGHVPYQGQVSHRPHSLGRTVA